MSGTYLRPLLIGILITRLVCPDNCWNRSMSASTVTRPAAVNFPRTSKSSFDMRVYGNSDTSSGVSAYYKDNKLTMQETSVNLDSGARIRSTFTLDMNSKKISYNSFEGFYPVTQSYSDFKKQDDPAAYNRILRTAQAWAFNGASLASGEDAKIWSSIDRYLKVLL